MAERAPQWSDTVATFSELAVAANPFSISSEEPMLADSGDANLWADQCQRCILALDADIDAKDAAAIAMFMSRCPAWRDLGPDRAAGRLYAPRAGVGWQADD